MRKYIERASYDWSEDSIRYINTPTASARSAYLYVQEVGNFKTKEPYFTERIYLESYLIVCTVAGKGRLLYKGAEYFLEAGDVFFIDCKEHHYYECLPGGGWDFLWLHFNGVYAKGYYEEFAKTGFRIIFFEDTAFMESTISRILTLTQEKDLNSEVICSNLINNLVTELIIKNSRENGDLPYMPQFIKDIMKRLDIEFRDSISLEEIARDIGFSKFHVSREFKKHVGMTFTEYLITMRLNYAKELLKYTDESINEITFFCGMNNVSHFINLFKEREGMTPLQYRKQWRV